MNAVINIIVGVMILAVILRVLSLIIKCRRQARLPGRHRVVRLADQEIRGSLTADESNKDLVQEELDYEAERFAKDAKRAYEKMLEESDFHES